MRRLILGCVLLLAPTFGWATDPESTDIPPITGSLRSYDFTGVATQNSFTTNFLIIPVGTQAISFQCANVGANTITYKAVPVFDDTFIGADVVAATDILASGVSVITTWAPNARYLTLQVKSKVADTPGTFVCKAFAR